MRVTAVVAIAAIVGLGAWLALRSSDGSSNSATNGSTSTAVTAVAPVAVSQSGLATIAKGLNQPIYWAGAQKGMTYELTQTGNGRIYVRYLPAGVAVGSSHPYLTIATYPVTDAFSATSSVAQGAKSVKIPARAGGVAFYGKSDPTSVYEAFPGVNFQVEIYSPSPKQARKLVESGRIAAVSGGAQAASFTPVGPVAASVSSLEALSKPAHRLYWAGSRAGQTYELTQLVNGRVYVRYLPAGVKVGMNKPYLTIAAYPVVGAYGVTLAAAKKAGVVRIPIKGGIAFYSASSPTGVYLAFRGSNEQVEVYDPSAAEAHSLVASGKIRPLS